MLSDPDKRRQYDQFGHAAFDGGGGGGAGGFGGGFDFNGADLGDIFGDIFGDLFGGGGRGGRANNGPMKGANIRAVVRITFEEAVFGCQKRAGARPERYVRRVTEQVQNRELHRRLVQSVVERSDRIYTAVLVWYCTECTDLSGL